MNLKNLTEMQKKLIKFALTGIAIVFLIFIIIWIVKLINGNKLSFDKIEDKMVSAAEAYYKQNPHLLPDDDVATKELDVDELINTGHMKELEKYTDDNVHCSGKVIVLKNGEYYTFVPRLNCGGDYTTKNLVKRITAKSNIVTTGDGLYEMNGEYIYRGEKLNNYVSFAGKTWRILKITKDNDIRLIQEDFFEQRGWDDRYNDDTRTSSGINNFEVSRMKDDLMEIYNGNTFSSTDKAKIVPKQLCIGKRKETDTTKDGSTECSTLTKEYLPLGLLQVNEYLIPSLDSGCSSLRSRQCTNYNYLYGYERSFWSLTADSENTSKVYYIDYLPQSIEARTYSVVRLVLNVSGEVNYKKGNGTLESPYVID